MDKFRCQYCGIQLPDKISWDHHLDTCYSRTTVCSLCGTRMPTAHKDQHLRIIHGLISGFTDFNNHHDSVTNGDRRISPRTRNTVTNKASADLVGSADARMSKIAQQMELLRNHAPVFADERSMPKMRAVTKSPTLSRVAQRSTTNHGYNNNFTNTDNNVEVFGRKASPSPSRPMNNNFSSFSPSAGFSFRSNDQLLHDAYMNREQNSKTSQQTSYFLNNNATLNDPSLSKEMRAKNRLAVVEEVVHNIMTRASPPPHHHQQQQRQNEDGRSSNNKNNLGLLHAALDHHVLKSQYTPSNQFQQDSITSLRLSNNNNKNQNKRNNNWTSTNTEMAACPDCGKVILSLDKHTCDVECTECPKCGDVVPLLSFDRHFLECAVGPSWQTIREKRETDRMVMRNAASFRVMATRMPSSAHTGRSTSESVSKSRSASKGNNNNTYSDDDFGAKETSFVATQQRQTNNSNEIEASSTSSRADDHKDRKILSRNNNRSLNVGSWNDWNVNGDLKLSVDHMMPEVEPANGGNSRRYMSNLEIFKMARNASSSNSHHNQNKNVGRHQSSFEIFCNDNNLSSADQHHKLKLEKDFEKQRQEQQQRQHQQIIPPGFRPCALCNQLIHESKISQHLDVCDQNLLSCPLCAQGVPAAKLDEHKIVCEANRRRCPFCSTSIQFSRLADHVSKCCQDQGALGNGKMTMYHGTTEKAAREIIQNGFLPSASGLLGEGVYMTRDLAKAKNYGPVILEALVLIPGKILTVAKTGHRMQKSWQVSGYDAAWIPQGVTKSDGLEEHCIKNPQHIAVVKIIR